MSATPTATLARPPATTLPSRRRRLGRVVGERPGPTLLVVGSLHGNEPAGVGGIERLFAALADGAGLAGEVVGLIGNVAALEAGRRYLAEDLNRMWRRERVRAVRDLPAERRSAEEREMAALDVEVGRAVRDARAAGQPLYLLDLHTTSGGGPAFCVLEDTLPNRRFADALEAPLVLGLEEEVSGTLTHWLADEGVVTVGFEAGQHQDPAAPERAEAAIWLAMEVAGLLPRGARGEVMAARRRLIAEHRALPRVVEVRYRHAILPEDRFRMRAGLKTFDRVTAGQPLAEDRAGVVVSPRDGRLLMPLYQEQGDDGFFVVRPVAPAWLKISALLRRLRLERTLHLLPGVSRHPELEGSFLVDRRVARWGARQLFHLLGFRRRGARGGRFLVMTRRKFDV